ncbi:hypothetical protein DTL42_24920 [Bremerella cremea]|uniref:Uncharacterized protein n=1 Tax=Bremerella cremea TaxID=1031537 RepID=A0A368KJ65_9BACT|nr:hypothetical protein [Bremerella cremea]RCS40616.1 hypothetical protein DTL42_24920 [Bremerella cremea]
MMRAIIDKLDDYWASGHQSQNFRLITKLPAFPFFPQQQPPPGEAISFPVAHPKSSSPPLDSYLRLAEHSQALAAYLAYTTR